MIPKECKRLAEANVAIAVVFGHPPRSLRHPVAKVQDYWLSIRSLSGQGGGSA